MYLFSDNIYMKNLPLQRFQRIGIMKKTFWFVFVTCIYFFTSSLLAQTVQELSQQALNAENQEDRFSAAHQLQSVLVESLTSNSFTEPVSKIPNLSIQSSSDGFFRIFTWCVPLNQGFYEYFGIIQIFSEPSKIIILYDDPYEEQEERMILDKKHWFGAMYSKVITTVYKKQVYYTLLGWDGNNALSEKKVIDVVTFDEQGEPFFGKGIFSNCNNCKRIFLEYKKDANCNLRYEKQSGKFNGKKISKNMIVFEKLKPIDPYFEGMKSMYVPTDVFNAYFWKGGMWHFLENIDARNR